MDSCFETILNWAQRNYFKLDLRGLITCRSLLFVTPQNALKASFTMEDQDGEKLWVMRNSHSFTPTFSSRCHCTEQDHRQSPMYSFISSSNCVYTYCPICTVVVLMDLTESMICFSGWKWPGKVLLLKPKLIPNISLFDLLVFGCRSLSFRLVVFKANVKYMLQLNRTASWCQSYLTLCKCTQQQFCSKVK